MIHLAASQQKGTRFGPFACGGNQYRQTGDWQTVNGGPTNTDQFVLPWREHPAPHFNSDFAALAWSLLWQGPI